MKRNSVSILSSLCLLGAVADNAHAGKLTAEMKEGKPVFKSMGSLAFAPEGVLFIADTKAAAIVALDTQDTKPAKSATTWKVEGINQKIAGMLGTTADQILIEDMAVNPVSHNAYLSVSRGRGAEATPVLMRVKADGAVEAVSLDKVKFSRAELPDPPKDGIIGEGRRQTNPRRESITDLAYSDDRLLIAGLSNEEFSSTLRAVPFPFKTVSNGTMVEIYHGAHGQFETRAPVRTFAPFKVGKDTHLLAAYTCTPLVQFPLSALQPNAKVKGKTIAELGNRNRPLDMVVYSKDGKHYLLMSNSSRGVMKIGIDDFEKAESIVTPVQEERKGVGYETIEGLTGVEQLDLLDKQTALVMKKDASGAVSLESLPLP
jgi:hypothetical protein